MSKKDMMKNSLSSLAEGRRPKLKKTTEEGPKPIMDQNIRKTYKLPMETVEKLDSLGFFTFQEVSSIVAYALDDLFKRIESKEEIFEGQDSALDKKGNIKPLPEKERERRKNRYAKSGRRS